MLINNGTLSWLLVVVVELLLLLQNEASLVVYHGCQLKIRKKNVSCLPVIYHHLRSITNCPYPLRRRHTWLTRAWDIRSLTSSHLSWMLKRKRALSSFTSTLMNLMSCYLGWREIKRNADHKALGRWEEGSREEWRVLIDLSGSLSHQRGRTTIGHSMFV